MIKYNKRTSLKTRTKTTRYRTYNLKDASRYKKRSAQIGKTYEARSVKRARCGNNSREPNDANFATVHLRKRRYLRKSRSRKTSSEKWLPFGDAILDVTLPEDLRRSNLIADRKRGCCRKFEGGIGNPRKY